MATEIINFNEGDLETLIGEGKVKDGLLFVKTNKISDYIIQGKDNLIKYSQMHGLKAVRLDTIERVVGLFGHNIPSENTPLLPEYFIGKQLIIKSGESTYLSGEIEFVGIIPESKIQLAPRKFSSDLLVEINPKEGYLFHFD